MSLTSHSLLAGDALLIPKAPVGTEKVRLRWALGTPMAPTDSRAATFWHLSGLATVRSVENNVLPTSN